MKYYRGEERHRKYCAITDRMVEQWVSMGQISLVLDLWALVFLTATEIGTIK